MPSKVISGLKKNAPSPTTKPPASSSRSAKVESPAQKLALQIDHPADGQTIYLGHYAIRISAEPNAEVEVSIDGREWEGCRESIGFYWYDWWVDKPGTHKIKARVRVGKGRWKESDLRQCTAGSQSAN